MSQQIKLDEEVKKEIALYAAFTGLNLKDIVAASWEEFKNNHSDEFHNGLAWASGILGDPGKAAVAASGMSASDVAEIDAAFNGAASTPVSAEVGAASHA
jgi:hypothetical protein